ncbi:hypothetical protein DICPUDRAFT_87647 [Dictyostelium purpureum]|uniref:DSCP-N domain-containing protein n=1 Tax=Dictyostelium purpureum TaxID=5786 RepID=F0ZJI3_DICPU|nr:uncharacterized protein DICPUDRAFT_87647 [Dictyostelium purpureum]EGC35905.1 hypothetical protein DICPUDRAFT_87647 [Dictyostelium purpureum]|eukprot:XP_003287559.1 hypothetical protein DICPUDRAFT_87647 [Dictyostelium purpureum]
MFLYKYKYLFLILFILLIVYKINGLFQCETLDPELCLASYPNCIPLILKSCCAGQTGLCVDMDSAVDYVSNKKDKVTNCIKNIQTGIIFELYGPLNSIPGFNIYPPPNETCKDIGCEAKGLSCIYQPIANCESTSPCCQPQPICSDFTKLLMSNISHGRGNCDAQCPEGFNCRYIADEETCLPSKCDLVECIAGTECLPLKGLDIVSCFKKIEINDSPNANCDNVKCPNQFVCGKGVFSNADCLPQDIDFISEIFNCSKCPKDWKCDKFGWGGLCIEWKPSSPGDGVPCLGGFCLFNQYCNETSQQCEFERCTSTTCNKDMSCIQYQPSHPRVCSSTNIIPFTQIPDTIIPYSERYKDQIRAQR